MGRTAGRSAEDTRQQILRVATEMIGRHGTGVPVNDIAEAAGVSKGGLLYHFPNKEALLTGLAADLIAQFRRDVEQAATDEPEGTPGRLTRAYVRASFAAAHDVDGLRQDIALAAHLMFEPNLQQAAHEDAQQWRTELLNDGLPADRVRLIIAATDGANTGPLWGAVLSDTDRVSLEAELIALATPGSAGEQTMA